MVTISAKQVEQVWVYWRSMQLTVGQIEEMTKATAHQIGTLLHCCRGLDSRAAAAYTNEMLAIFGSNMNKIVRYTRKRWPRRASAATKGAADAFQARHGMSPAKWLSREIMTIRLGSA